MGEQNLRPCRGQFVIGPDPVRKNAWRSLRLDEQHVLSFDPDLNVSESQGDTCRLTLLGYILDWSDPEAGNDQILRRLSESSADLEACIASCADLGGRWVLIHQESQSIRIYHDSSGLKQVCYASGGADDSVFCASQPKLLAEIAGLEEEEAALAFIDRQEAANSEYWWPGNRLPYKNAYALLPNHSLDILTGNVERYWPLSNAAQNYRYDAERAANILQGSIAAASKRFELALGLSAGWDSRILLAASRPIRENLIAYTAVSASMNRDDADGTVPGKIAGTLGLAHDFIHQPAAASEEFASVVSQHVWRPHSRFLPGMQAEYQQYTLSKVAVIGNVAEVVKCPYRNQADRSQKVSGDMLAALIGMGDEEFAIDALDEWLASIPSGTGYSVLDLFYWEQRLGRWLAANCVEFELVWQDICFPFNCRTLICELLACDEKHRQMRNPAIFSEIMRKLWPEVLAFPINPKPKQGRLSWIRRLLRRLSAVRR